MEVSGQFHAPAAVSPGKEPQVPIGQEPGCAPESIWTLFSREKSLTPARNSAVRPVTRPTISLLDIIHRPVFI
jgi:hypothetical protein